MASKLPVYSIPPYRKASTRAFLTLKTRNNFEGKKNPKTTSLVFDNFIVFLKNQSRILVKWDVDLNSDQFNALNRIVSCINYLGRSESWVRMQVESSEPQNIKWNSSPLNINEHKRINSVNLAVPVPKNRYSQIAVGWLEAICMQTEEIQEKKLSDSYGVEYQNYSIPEESTDEQEFLLHEQLASNVNYIEYGLESNVLPSIKDSIKIADRFHIYVNGIYGKQNGGRNSEKLSGRDKFGNPLKDHKHIFIIPMDSNRDGLIDRIVIKCNNYLDESELEALFSTRKLYSNDTEEGISLIIRKIGDKDQINNGRKYSTEYFVSATPYITKRHYKRNKGSYSDWIKEDLKKELSHHGIPIPVSIEIIDREPITAHNFRWYDFETSRKQDKPFQGFGFKISFDEPVNSPFVVGHECHFGMGLFVCEGW